MILVGVQLPKGTITGLKDSFPATMRGQSNGNSIFENENLKGTLLSWFRDLKSTIACVMFHGGIKLHIIIRHFALVPSFYLVPGQSYQLPKGQQRGFAMPPPQTIYIQIIIFIQLSIIIDWWPGHDTTPDNYTVRPAGPLSSRLPAGICQSRSVISCVNSWMW